MSWVATTSLTYPFRLCGFVKSCGASRPCKCGMNWYRVRMVAKHARYTNRNPSRSAKQCMTPSALSGLEMPRLRASSLRSIWICPLLVTL